MSNLASMSLISSVGRKSALTSILGQSTKELNALLSRMTQLEGTAARKEKAVEQRDKRRDWYQTVGGIGTGALAFVLSGGNPLWTALGTGAGSYGAGELAEDYALTLEGLKSRKSQLEKVTQETIPGLFHTGKKENIKRGVQKINRFLDSAQRDYDTAQKWTSILSAVKAHQLASGLGKTDLFGKEKGMFAPDVSDYAKEMGLTKGQAMWDVYKSYKSPEKMGMSPLTSAITTTSAVTPKVSPRTDFSSAFETPEDFVQAMQSPGLRQIFGEKSAIGLFDPRGVGQEDPFRLGGYSPYGQNPNVSRGYQNPLLLSQYANLFGGRQNPLVG